MLNKKGNFLIDAMLALVLAAFMVFLVSAGWMSKVQSLRKERVALDEVLEIEASASRLHDD